MRKLYVDRYRGFRDTWIPISDVNFLLGENSTGKTSILSLINVLGSFDFWFRQEFNNEEVELGAFKDIRSASEPEATSFSVGMIDCPDGPVTEHAHNCAFLMIFVQRRGMPRLSQWSFIAGNQQVRISLTDKAARYSIKPTPTADDLAGVAEATFRSWLAEPLVDTHGFLLLRDAPPDRPIYIYDVLRAQAMALTGGASERRPAMLRYPGPPFAASMTWLAPVRSKPARIYSGLSVTYSPEGEHTPHSVRTILSRRAAAHEFRDFTSSFGAKSRLFDDIYVRNFGRSVTSPFELGIVLDGARIVISDVGYGLSQALPILVEMFSRADDRNHLSVLQQPEVHLHPKAQAALGELVFNLALDRAQRFLIETHSDFLVDRFRIMLRESDAETKPSSQVLFFDRDNLGNTVHPIPISTDGSYPDSQPTGFREFFLREQLRLLGL